MSTISGKCDICGKDFMKLRIPYSFKQVYSYVKIGHQHIDYTKGGINIEEICYNCYDKISAYIETLKPDTRDDFEKGFEEAFKNGK